jgi:NAD(P) transhydrogenase
VVQPLPSAKYDLVILGAGPAGEKAAAQAGYFGKRVAIVERAPEPGGAGVHTGTLPSKTLRESAVYLSGYRNRELYGIAVQLEPGATLPVLMARKAAIAGTESERIRENLKRHHVDYFAGHGRITGPNAVTVATANGNVELGGEFLLIATGSRPFRPSGIAFDDPRIHDSDEILCIERLPSSLAILGAGVIGCEYACMFAALGTKVTLVDARPEILPFLDLEIVERLKAAMVGLGIRLEQGRRWRDVVATDAGVSTTLEDGSEVRSEQLLFAAGRVGRTEDLGLDSVGLRADARGCLAVDASFRTGVPSILAAGDVIGFPALASTSMEQGRVAICRAFGFAYKHSVAEVLPYGIYTIPEVSSVGETEQTCREKGIAYVAGRALYRDNARGKIAGDVEGMTKLVIDAKTRRVLGVHVIGERATELVHIGQTALHLSATVDLFIDMVFNFPTLAESYKYAAYACLGALRSEGESGR